jgi:GMP synthase-like glutamine amidotransferase
MLNADVPVPNVFAQRAPTYGRIFHQLLQDATNDHNKNNKITIESADFDVMQQHYPSSLDSFDAIIISGSANSAYDDLPWIKKLDAYIRHVYENEPRVKIFGSCFGHQIVCQSLLREYGVKVEKDPNGWEIGVQSVILHPQFRTMFKSRTGFKACEKMKLQFVHHDHVVFPESNTIPADWMSFGATEHCAVQGVYEAGRVLTLQGHFEFDRFVNSECIKYFFGEKWDAARLQEALLAIDADDDSNVAAGMILGFLLEKGGEVDSAGHKVTGGLLTPPDEV